MRSTWIALLGACLFLSIASPAHALGGFLNNVGKTLSDATSYPQVKIANNTPYRVRGTVKYAACRSDSFSVESGQTWTASSRRGACLVTEISGTPVGQPAVLRGTAAQSFGENKTIINYQSTGTGFAQFRIEPFGGRYRIFSLREHTAVTDTRNEKSPGFRITNRTPWPIAVSIDQVGCLNYGVIPAQFNGRPGVFKRKTGAVWFTIRAQIQPSGQDHRDDWDCIRPVAELVGDVALAAMSGGGSAAASAGRIAAKQVAKAAIKAATRKAIKKVATFSAKEMGEYLMQNGSLVMPGQFAGYDWPFKCDRMPNYEITGGPIPNRDEDGEFYLEDGPPLTIRKLNDCGNDAMFASPKTQRAEPISVASFGRSDNSFAGSTSGGSSYTPNTPRSTGGNVKGWSVRQVNYRGGNFRQTGNGRWTEYAAGGRRFTFTETGRDEWSVYLEDRSRNIAAQLDLWRKKISVGNIGQNRGDLYDITSSSIAVGASSSSRQQADSAARERERQAQLQRQRQQQAAARERERQRQAQLQRQRQQQSAARERERQRQAQLQRQRQQQAAARERERQRQAQLQRQRQQQAAARERERQRQAQLQRQRQQQAAARERERQRQAQLQRQRQQQAAARERERQRQAQLAAQRAREETRNRLQQVTGRQPPRRTSTPTSGVVKGPTVRNVRYNGGRFQQTGNRQWTEFAAGGRRFTFSETHRDEWSVYLVDRSRNIQAQLDLHRKKISLGAIGGQRNDAYNITGATR